MTKFFRAPADAYEQFRLEADVILGLPSSGDETSVTPAECAAHDDNGNVLFAADDGMTFMAPAWRLLGEFVGRGKVVELSEQEYLSAIVSDPKA